MHGSLLGAVVGVSGMDRLLRLSRERRDRGGRVGLEPLNVDDS
jgi:hypothetical protein